VFRQSATGRNTIALGGAVEAALCVRRRVGTFPGTERRRDESMAKGDRKDPGNEGEGSRTAARRYEEGVAKHVKKGNVEAEADAARRDVEASPEEFRRAEEEGRRPSAGDLKSDLADENRGKR
jgi:hypothetical protein